jgi:TnpA family transposase
MGVPLCDTILLKIPHQIIYEGNYMARRQILSLSERESLLALPDDELTLTRMAYFSEHDLALISAHRKPASRFGFAVLLCYLKNVGFARIKKSHPLMRC